MMSSGNKSILNKRLSDLLGFQDGASDVLEHLLTIESSKDLLDYLSQLLGTDNEKVQSLVSDIGRFQRGEPIVADDDEDADDNNGTDQQQQQQPGRSMSKSTPAAVATTTATKPVPPPASKKSATSVPASNKKTAPQSQQPKSQNNQSRASSNNNTSNLVPLQKTATASTTTNNKGKTSPTSPPPPPASQVSKTPPPTTQAPAVAAAAAVPAAPRPPPKKGKAKVECGCFGYLHKPLTNCLFCGRVSCEREGYDFCNFCGYQVQPPPAQGSSSSIVHDAAWVHKEKLLRYDRESAQRTLVLDDQADYFSNASERFMSQQERDEAREKEEERTRKTHQRQKMQLNLAL